MYTLRFYCENRWPKKKGIQKILFHESFIQIMSHDVMYIKVSRSKAKLTKNRQLEPKNCATLIRSFRSNIVLLN
jgi:hypothetical protein